MWRPRLSVSVSRPVTEAVSCNASQSPGRLPGRPNSSDGRLPAALRRSASTRMTGCSLSTSAWARFVVTSERPTWGSTLVIARQRHWSSSSRAFISLSRRRKRTDTGSDGARVSTTECSPAGTYWNSHTSSASVRSITSRRLRTSGSSNSRSRAMNNPAPLPSTMPPATTSLRPDGKGSCGSCALSTRSKLPSLRSMMTRASSTRLIRLVSRVSMPSRRLRITSYSFLLDESRVSLSRLSLIV